MQTEMQPGGEVRRTARDHWVYRCFDRNDELLYVGLTSCGLSRFAEGHARTAEWWPLVERIEIEHFDSRARARSRERSLIRRCAPLHNVADNALRIPRPPAKVTARYITERELAIWLDVDPLWVERRLREGMPFWRVGGIPEGLRRRFKAAEVLVWLAAEDLFEQEDAS